VFAFVADFPPTQSRWAHTNNFANSLRLSPKGRVTKKAANIFGSFVCGGVQEYQAVFGVSQIRFVEIHIACEKTGTPQGMQQWDYIVPILHPTPTYFKADLTEMNFEAN
jgi:hypothetical protein